MSIWSFYYFSSCNTNSILNALAYETNIISYLSPLSLIDTGWVILWSTMWPLWSNLTEVFFFFPGKSRNTVPHYHKLCGWLSHIWGNRSGQHIQTAMDKTHPGKTTFLIMVSPLTGECHWSLFMLNTYVHVFAQTIHSGISFPLVLLDGDFSVYIFEKLF